MTPGFGASLGGALIVELSRVQEPALESDRERRLQARRAGPAWEGGATRGARPERNAFPWAATSAATLGASACTAGSKSDESANRPRVTRRVPESLPNR